MDSGEVQTLSLSSTESPVKSKSPWYIPTKATPTPCSLAAVMDEELARKLQTEEETAYKQGFLAQSSPKKLLSEGPAPADTCDDLLLAQMLQLEFDREHDLMLQAEEKHFNKNSKVHISFEKYRSLPDSLLEDEDDDQYCDHSDDEGSSYGGPKDTKVQAVASKGRRRSKGVPVGMTTKHDPVLCGRKNVRNMEKFPPDFPAGDIQDESQDYRLPNSVFNTLKLHSHKEEKHAQKLHEKKEHSTQEQALDPKTRLMLFKLVDGGVLAEVNGCVSTGKEACVYHAAGGSPEDRTVPAECAIKVFKTTLNEFKNRDRYIKDDYRFKERFGKQNPRKVVKLWAEKEMHNLKRLRDGGVNCPEVVLLKKHVLIMSFIGRDMKPAPKLKEVRLSADKMKSAYQQCIKGMKRMYTVCRLVHSDLSEYNMLWHNGEVYFIDVGQSVEPSHPHGLEFLFRDCTNVSQFFNKTGQLHEVMTPQQLFNYVSDLGIHADSDEEFLIQLRNHRQRESLMQAMHSKTSYPFDYFFEQTTTSSAGASDTACAGSGKCSSTKGRVEESSSASDSD